MLDSTVEQLESAPEELVEDEDAWVREVLEQVKSSMEKSSKKLRAATFRLTGSYDPPDSE